jgi:hypothetical protein
MYTARVTFTSVHGRNYKQGQKISWLRYQLLAAVDKGNFIRETDYKDVPLSKETTGEVNLSPVVFYFRGIKGLAMWDIRANYYHGTLKGIRRHVSFRGHTPETLLVDFQEAVNRYLDSDPNEDWTPHEGFGHYDYMVDDEEETGSDIASRHWADAVTPDPTTIDLADDGPNYEENLTTDYGTTDSVDTTDISCDRDNPYDDSQSDNDY